MQTQMQETATISQAAIDYGKVLNPQQGEWTIQSLGIDMERKTPYTKADFEKAPKKVSRKSKK